MEVLLARKIEYSPLSGFAATVAWICICLAGQAIGQTTPGSGKPHFNARQHQTGYAGPSDAKRPVQDIAEVRIGYFGPSDPKHASFGRMWTAAMAAVDDANKKGGLQGKPFRLVPAWSENPWGTGIKDLTRLVYEDQVLAIVGGVDGPSTHLAEQVVAKARLPLVSPVATDKTVNLANVPWMFSMAPGDHQIAEALAPAIASKVQGASFVLITANDHDSYLFTRELRKALQKRQLMPEFQFEFKPGSQKISDVVGRCRSANPVAIVIVADADNTSRIVRLLREGGLEQSIFGGLNMARQQFLDAVAAVDGELICPIICGPRTESKWPPGCSLRARADFVEQQTYDSVKVLIDAIRRAGLSRTEIGRELRKSSPWQGLAGEVRWDGLGANTRPVRIGTIKAGRIVPQKPAEE